MIVITPWDEPLCHQISTTMDHVLSSDPAWTERIYISLYDVATKQTILGCGVGQYPNRNVLSRFGIATEPASVGLLANLSISSFERIYLRFKSLEILK